MSKTFRQKKAKGEEGNTEPLPQPTRKTFYCFTLFNFNDDIKIELNRQLQLICKKYKYGEEICPETKKQHLQGFFHLKKAMRITEIKLINNPHLEPCKGSEEQNVNYVSKDGIVTSFGFPKPIKVIENLRPYQSDIIKVIESEPDDRSIYWYWEATGGIGKSALCRYIVNSYNALICSGKASDMKFMIVNYFNKNGYYPDIIIFDIPRSSLGYISYTGIEEIKNGLFASSKYESDMVLMPFPHVICFANEEPDRDMMSLDRWKITELISASG